MDTKRLRNMQRSKTFIYYDIYNKNLTPIINK